MCPKSKERRMAIDNKLPNRLRQHFNTQFPGIGKETRKCDISFHFVAPRIEGGSVRLLEAGSFNQNRTVSIKAIAQQQPINTARQTDRPTVSSVIR